MKTALQNWLEECHPESLPVLEAVTDEQWNEYDRLIGLYSSGFSCDVGWLSLIESSLVRAGVSKRAAFLMAIGREAFEQE